MASVDLSITGNTRQYLDALSDLQRFPNLDFVKFYRVPTEAELQQFPRLKFVTALQSTRWGEFAKQLTDIMLLFMSIDGFQIEKSSTDHQVIQALGNEVISVLSRRFEPRQVTGYKLYPESQSDEQNMARMISLSSWSEVVQQQFKKAWETLSLIEAVREGSPERKSLEAIQGEINGTLDQIQKRYEHFHPDQKYEQTNL